MGYVVSATWTANPGQEGEVAAALTALSVPSRQEPGNQIYQAYQDPDQPQVFRIFEVYDDEAAFTAHAESAHFAEHAKNHALALLSDRSRQIFQTVG